MRNTALNECSRRRDARTENRVHQDARRTRSQRDEPSSPPCRADTDEQRNELVGQLGASTGWGKAGVYELVLEQYTITNLHHRNIPSRCWEVAAKK